MPYVQHQYKPLDRNKGEIRLIQIQGSQDSHNLIQCTIRHFSQNKVPHYDCLSYTWGDPAKTRPIQVDGMVLNITHNLYDALHQLRERETLAIWQNPWIWIDAISINQADETEKSNQVQQMKFIFANSRQVIIWLGLQSDDSKHALWLLDHIGYLWKAYAKHEMTREQQLCKVWDELMSKEDLRGIKALQNLFERPWWTRVWVYQEAMAAKNSRIVCGPDSARFQSISLLHNLNNGWRQLPVEHRAPSWEALYPELVSAIRRTKQVYSSTQLSSGTSRPILAVLDQIYVHSLVQASDPRDRLFALYGLETNATELGLIVDYSRDCNTIYEETARVLLATYGLVALSYCSGQRKYHSNLSLPSWVPNWEKYIMSPIHAFPSIGRKSNPESNFFSASGLTSQPRLSTSPLDGKLSLLGVQVSFIMETGSSWPFAPLTVPDISEMHAAEHQWISTIRRLAAKQPPTPEGCLRSKNMSAAVWRIAIADHLQKPGVGYTRALEADIGGYDAILEFLTITNGETNSKFVHEERKKLERESWDYRKSMINCAVQRRPILTADGRVGIGPDICHAGDIVCIFYGAKVPFIIRKNNKNEYVLLGEAYIHGIMDGEVMDGECVMEKFVLC
jgi:hypothetical protein